MTGTYSPRGLLDVSRETHERLSHFVDLVIKWNRSINLVAPSTIDAIWNRHIHDSAQLLDYRKFDHGQWVDFGSGGGLPALVLAILAKEKYPKLEFNLVESDQRKAVFLNQAIRETGLSAKVFPTRTELLHPFGSNVVSARAVAALDVLCGWASRHLADGGRAIFPKGAKFSDEIATARQNWTFDLLEVPSVTEANAKVLILENIRHV